MATETFSPAGLTGPAAGPSNAARALTRTLLACGVLYGVAYVLANDVVAAALVDGYSRAHQAISELSATAAPSRGFLRAMLPVFTALLVGFGLGVLRVAAGSRALKATGALLLAGGVAGVSWLWFPMTSRQEMGTGPMPANDVGHLVLSGLTVVLIVLQMAFGAAAFGTRFRLFTAAALATTVGFGVLTSVVAQNLVDGGPTRWMGLYERIGVGAWLAWMAVLALALLRTRAPARP